MVPALGIERRMNRLTGLFLTSPVICPNVET